MTINDVKDFISTLGFPIFIAVWMLIRDARIISNITKALVEITDALADQKETIMALTRVVDDLKITLIALKPR